MNEDKVHRTERKKAADKRRRLIRESVRETIFAEVVSRDQIRQEIKHAVQQEVSVRVENMLKSGGIQALMESVIRQAVADVAGRTDFDNVVRNALVDAVLVKANEFVENQVVIHAVDAPTDVRKSNPESGAWS